MIWSCRHSAPSSTQATSRNCGGAFPLQSRPRSTEANQANQSIARVHGRAKMAGGTKKSRREGSKDVIAQLQAGPGLMGLVHHQLVRHWFHDWTGLDAIRRSNARFELKKAASRTCPPVLVSSSHFSGRRRPDDRARGSPGQRQSVSKLGLRSARLKLTKRPIPQQIAPNRGSQQSNLLPPRP